MHVIRGIFLIGGLCLVAWIVLINIQQYRLATGSQFQRILAMTRNSATILWAYLVGFFGFMLSYASQIGDFFGMTEVRTFITAYLTPEIVSGVFVAVAAITVAARIRGLLKERNGTSDNDPRNNPNA